MQDFHYLVGKVIAQCWLDNELYKDLIQNPLRVLREAGVVLDETIEIAVRSTQTGSGVEVEGNTLALKI